MYYTHPLSSVWLLFFLVYRTIIKPDPLFISPSATQDLKDVTVNYSAEALSVQWGEDWTCNWHALGLKPSLFIVFIMTTEMVNIVQLYVLQTDDTGL